MTGKHSQLTDFHGTQDEQNAPTAQYTRLLFNFLLSIINTNMADVIILCDKFFLKKYSRFVNILQNIKQQSHDLYT